MKKIKLTRGLYTYVDDADYHILVKHKWYAAKQPNTYYAARTTKINGHKITIWMHRVINKTPEGLKTDHKDGDGLNNVRSNLRSVSHQDNLINNTRKKNGKYSKHRGVTYHRRNQKWQAQITVNWKNIYIGMFDTEEEAAEAYRLRRDQLLKGKLYRR